MIAVVVNSLNKAYFLRENDPVFNGYVVKITGDSIIFKETLQDKLGKPFDAGSDEEDHYPGGLGPATVQAGNPSGTNLESHGASHVRARGEKRNAKATAECFPTAAGDGADCRSG